MTHVWQLQDAKNRFSEVVAQALKHGPQVITKRSVETAIVLSVAGYRTMLLAQQSLSDFFRASPLVGAPLDLARDSGPSRTDVKPASAHKRVSHFPVSSSPR